MFTRANRPAEAGSSELDIGVKDVEWKSEM